MSELAQGIGLIAKEFGYPLEQILKMSIYEYNFLLAWLDWYYRVVRG
ncbi:MAG: hypothetical protein QW334_00265 [Thermofilum sp.]